MSETISDYKERCRICFTDFTTAESGIELDGILIEQLEHLISFHDLSDKLLPQKICCECQLRLDECYRFKTQIAESHLFLAQLLEDQAGLTDTQSEDQLEESQNENSNSLDNFCPICHKNFKDRREISYHVERVHKKIKNHQCDMCNYRCFKKFDMSLHIINIHMKESSSDWKVLCPQCGRKFRNKSDLRRHEQKQHLMIKRFKCENCEFSSFERSALILHTKTHLPIESRSLFECKKCGKLLSTRNTLKAHDRAVHQNIRSFACHICSKTFAQKSCLTKHKTSVHDRSKEHQCDICQIFVSQACYLKKHKQLMHPRDGIKVRHKCNTCDQDFSTEHALNNHERIHKDPEFECHHCHKKFYRKGNLLDHQEHHETLAYPCTQCKRSFRNESKLNHHSKKVHYKEKSTYRCELCSSTFTRRTTYRDHVLRQHKDLDSRSRTELLKRIAKMLPEEKTNE